jgi:simple sugar transport system ATP-binding protein
MSSVNYPVKLMSGGNQQKLLFAREIGECPRVLIATYPSRGLDVGAVESIHKVLLKEKEKGTAILLISEDLDEIFKLGDRIAVLHEGRVMAEMPREEATYEKIGWYMLGEKDLSTAI